MDHIAGKTVVITGASRGIGAATARHLAGLNARVVLAARDADALAALAEETGGLAVPCDVADYTQVANLIETAGSVDALINNAGLIDPIARLEDSDPDAWDRVVDVNFKGVYHGIRAVLPQMIARGSGTIINISSGAATNVLEGWSHYCATKAGVLSLTRMVHKEAGETGVRSIGLSPGTVATDMQREIKASGLNPVSEMEWESHIPPEWVGQAIAGLLGSVGDAFLGQDFTLKTNEERSLVGLPPLS
ncbi:MAG: SDR family oxidoreductase [Paracoccaceae bacterium]